MDKDHFELYPHEISELIDLWNENTGKYRKDIDYLLIDVLRDLESNAGRNYQAPSTPETYIQDSLASSAGYSAEIIEYRLKETINDNLECQRRAPDRFRSDIASELLSQFKLLATECFIAGVTAGKFNLLPFEPDLVRAEVKRKKLNSENNKRHNVSEDEGVELRVVAAIIIKELKANPRQVDIVKNKSEIARRVKRRTSTSISIKTISRKISPLF
jgi:hypothetical protein